MEIEADWVAQVSAEDDGLVRAARMIGDVDGDGHEDRVWLAQDASGPGGWTSAVALRNTPLMLRVLERAPDPKPAIMLLGEAFDMLEEDLDEERFFVAVRKGYWAAPERSPTRALATALIQLLEF